MPRLQLSLQRRGMRVCRRLGVQGLLRKGMGLFGGAIVRVRAEYDSIIVWFGRHWGVEQRK